MKLLKEKLQLTIVPFFQKLEMKNSLIGEKIFLKKDQTNFLKLSLDYNQAHRLDVRQNQFKSKKTVVHGVNLLLNAIELFLKYKDKKIYKVNCGFLKPVFLNEKIKFYFYKNEKDSFIEVENYKKEICAKIFLVFLKSKKTKTKLFKNKINEIKRIKKYENFDTNNYLKKKYKITLLKNKKFSIFPEISKVYGDIFCDAICASSYFIGMKCPGQKAIFTNIKFDLKMRKTLKFLLFDVYNYDSRFNLFSIKVEGFLHMKLQSILTK